MFLHDTESPGERSGVLRFFLGGLLFGSCLGAAEPPGIGTSREDLQIRIERMAKIGSCYSPSFSPDGEHLAFVSDLNGVPQVWTVPTKGGFPTLVTALEDQVGAVLWSPAGDRLVFSLAPGGGLNQQIYQIRADGSELRRITAGGSDNNWLGKFSRGGKFLSLSSSRLDPGSMDIWLYEFAAEELSLLVDNEGIGFLADLDVANRRGVVYRMESRGDNNLYLVDLRAGEEQLLTPHDPPGSFGGGIFANDGRSIYLSSNAGRDLIAFARVTLDEAGEPGGIEVLAERSAAELQSFELSHSGRLAALVWNQAGRNELQLLDLRTLEILPTPRLPTEIVSSLTFSRDDAKLAMVLSGAAAPSDIWILHLADGDLRQITRSPHAGVDLDSMVRPELVRYPAQDGLELTGWLYRSAVEGPSPFVISFHGGPESQARPSFNRIFQALLSQGIGVFTPNVRGSSGFGKRFVNLDNGELRFDAIKDIAASAAFLTDNGHAEPGQLGIMGGSYGGYMTMAGLAWYPDLFAAGVNLFGIVNFATFFEQTEPWMAAVSKVEYGDPDTQQQLLRDLSPIHKVDRIRAPTLVLHGANDTNVPVVEAEQVVETLKKRSVPVEYVLFPDEGHGFRKTVNRTRMVVEIVRWFGSHLQDADAPDRS